MLSKSNSPPTPQARLIDRYDDHVPDFVRTFSCGEDNVCEALQEEVNCWKNRDPVLIDAPTGRGKTTLVYKVLIPRAMEQGKNVLLISNRVAISTQQKAEIMKLLNSSLIGRLTDEGIRQQENFGMVRVVTYHRLPVLLKDECNRRWLDNLMYVVADEAHFFTADSSFNENCDYYLKLITSKFQHAIRVYLTATIWDVLHPLAKAEKENYVKGNTYNGTYLQPVQNHLIPHFGNVPLDNILPIHVQEYVNQAIKTYKPETVKKDIAVLSFIMQHAVENGLCKSNPVTKSIRLPKIERADKTAYTQEQYDIAYEFAKNYPDGLSIMLLLETGISRSELLGLTWADFDPNRGIIHIRQGLVSYKDADEGCVTVSDGLKNEYRRRSIPIVEPELLKRLREKPRQITYTIGDTEITVETTHIFHSPEGKPYQPNNWNNRVFLRYMNALVKAHPELPKLSAHELRHTRATLWIAQGVSPMMAARLLGHSDLKMLMRIYDHTDVETLRNAITSATKK